MPSNGALHEGPRGDRKYTRRQTLQRNTLRPALHTTAGPSCVALWCVANAEAHALITSLSNLPSAVSSCQTLANSYYSALSRLTARIVSSLVFAARDHLLPYPRPRSCALHPLFVATPNSSDSSTSIPSQCLRLSISPFGRLRFVQIAIRPLGRFSDQTQFLWTLLIMALVGNMIHEAFAGNPSMINYDMFVAVFSMLSLIYLIPATLRDAFVVHPMIVLIVDVLNTLFFFIAGVAMAAKLHVHGCNDVVSTRAPVSSLLLY